VILSSHGFPDINHFATAPFNSASDISAGQKVTGRRPDGNGTRCLASRPCVQGAPSLGEPSGSRIPRSPRFRPTLDRSSIWRRTIVRKAGWLSDVHAYRGWPSLMCVRGSVGLGDLPGSWIRRYEAFGPPFNSASNVSVGEKVAGRRPDGHRTRFLGSRPCVRGALRLRDPSRSRIPRSPRLRPASDRFDIGQHTIARNAGRLLDGHDDRGWPSSMCVQGSVGLGDSLGSWISKY